MAVLVGRPELQQPGASTLLELEYVGRHSTGPQSIRRAALQRQRDEAAVHSWSQAWAAAYTQREVVVEDDRAGRGARSDLKSGARASPTLA